MKSAGHYYGIVAESYDLWFPGEEFEDYEFYRRMIEAAPGPALEVGCGTGRLLLPYLREGLDVEGVDASADMLAICRRKAEQQSLSPVLHQQYVQELALPRRYATIYIPFGTFMLLWRLEEAFEALRRIYAHLEPGGQALISTDVPRDMYEARPGREWMLRRAGIRPSDGAEVLISEADEYDFVEQVVTGYYRYEVYKGGALIDTHFHTMKLRWYSKHELAMMLEKVGFCDIFVYGDYTDQEAVSGHETMIFRGRR